MIILLFVCSVLVTSVAGQQVPIVTIAQGTVIGSVATDGNYYEFHGIPYAGSTSGIHRFKAPLPAPIFTTHLVANRKDIKCVRALGFGFEGTEDCLVANVFTPTLDTARRLSVMVWIKGKEFDQAGDPELSFRNFVQKDVVVVSLNYRESILGFLCLGTETAPGNAGLKDIIAGLKWVKQNIAQFGGNPEDITLFGHGSGAAAVDLVTMSPMGKGLVQKAIAQSGNALAPWAVSRDNMKYALLVAEALGHEIESIQQLSEVFTRASVSALMGVINYLDLTDNSLAFAPCVERKELDGVEPFLTKTPAEIISKGEFADIPMIFGFVDNEGTIRAEEALNDDWLHRMQENFTDFLPPDLQFRSDDDEKKVAQQIRQYYFPENEENNEIRFQEYLKYHGDTMILVSTVQEARDRMFNSKLMRNARFYLYQFSYSGALGKPFVLPIHLDSAVHSEELSYMFYNTPVTGTSDLDQIMGNIIVERWTNFAKFGDPKSETSQVLWLPFTSFKLTYIRQPTSTEIGTAKNYELSLRDPHNETITFWDIIHTDHFRDAQSNWSLGDRGDDATTTSTTAPKTSNPDADTTTSTPAPGDSSTPDPDTSPSTPAPGDSSTPDPDTSPSTPAPGYSSTPDPDTSPSTPAPGDSSTPDPGTSTSSPAPGDSTTPDPNSASTTIAYTFLIISLFSLLSHFHSSLIL